MGNICLQLRRKSVSKCRDMGIVCLEMMALGVRMNETPSEGGANSIARSRILGNSISLGMS